MVVNKHVYSLHIILLDPDKLNYGNKRLAMVGDALIRLVAMN